MGKVLVDTEILLDILRGASPAQEFLRSHLGMKDLCCSVVNVAKVYASLEKGEAVKAKKLISGLHVYPLVMDVAIRAGEMKSRYKDLELEDCLIAATAQHLGAVLATRNIHKFPQKGVKVKVPY